MALNSKEARPAKSHPQTEEVNLASDADFDFGDPEILPVEISPGKFLELREPSASDLIEIDKIGKRKDLNDIETTLGVICILHYPGERGVKLNMRQAKRLTNKQILILTKAISYLMGNATEEEEGEEKEEEENDIKSEEEL